MATGNRGGGFFRIMSSPLLSLASTAELGSMGNSSADNTTWPLGKRCPDSQLTKQFSVNADDAPMSTSTRVSGHMDAKQSCAALVGRRLINAGMASAHLVRRNPLLTLLPPLLIFAVLLTAGEMGVWAGAQALKAERLTLTVGTCSRVAQQLDFLLQTWSAPTIAAAAVVSQQPHVPVVIASAGDWMEQTVGRLDPINTTANLIVLPWNIQAAVFPRSSTNMQMLNQDYNPLPSVSRSVQEAAKGPPGWVELVEPLSSASCPPPNGCVCARQVLWLPTSNPNETWGNELHFTPPWAMNASGERMTLGNVTVHPQFRADACGSNCSRYASRPLPDGRWLAYWGLIDHCVLKSSLTRVLDPLAAKAIDGVRFKFVLYRSNSRGQHPVSNSNSNSNTPLEDDDVVYESKNTSEPRSAVTDGICQEVGLTTNTQLGWRLCLAPVDSYRPAWQVPCQVLVVLVAIFLSLLVFLLMLSYERNRSLVEAMLPRKVVRRLGFGETYAEPFRNVTILFSDIVSYTSLSSELSPNELVELLDRLYTGFDALVDKHKLYKVETIGDAFVCVGGAPEACDPRDAAVRVARMALDMVSFVRQFETDRKLQIRVGIYSGDVTAAVMGRKMPHWCLVGDTVNVSSRMESNSRPMQVHVGAPTARLLQLSSSDEFLLEPRGSVDIKGKGPMCTFWLHAKQPFDESSFDLDVEGPMTPSSPPTIAAVRAAAARPDPQPAALDSEPSVMASVVAQSAAQVEVGAVLDL